jgi:hypothetical protein
MTVSIDALLSQKLMHYVYELLDPTLSPPQVFYVGEGVGGRVLSHLVDPAGYPMKPELLPSANEDERQARLARIRKIRGANLEPGVRIAVYGLPDKEAARNVEAALIATYKRAGIKLTNRNRGFGVDRIGRDLALLRAELGAADIEVAEQGILVPCQFVHKPLPAGVMPWEASERLRRYNSQREWHLGVRAQPALRQKLRAGDEVLLFAVSSEGICMGAWPIIRYDDNGKMFVLSRVARNEFLKRRLVTAGKPLTPQQAHRFVNWTP